MSRDEKSDKWAAEHPIAFIALTGFIAALVLFLVGIPLSGLGIVSSELIARWIFNIILGLPSVVIWCFIYRYVTTGQFSNVQVNIHPRQQEPDSELAQRD